MTDSSIIQSVPWEAVSVKEENMETSPERVLSARSAAVLQGSDPDIQNSTLGLCLPAGWIHALPVVDQQWISETLFKWSQTGQPELDFAKVDKIWWYPPQPLAAPNDIPAMVKYFGHPLFLWMPVRLWQVRLFCPHEDCGMEDLTSVGLHQNIKQVVGFSSTYFMAAECLSCKSCNRRTVSWSRSIVCQLDMSHRVQFPCLVTSKLGCDVLVVRKMRHRGMGNNSTSSQVHKHLKEEHSEVWQQKQIQFLTDFRRLMQTVVSGVAAPIMLGDLPAMLPVPERHWLMQVYCQDVLNRLEEIKASITSHFGRILKMDSSKKMLKKLAGESCATAFCATNVANEHGQIIMSVLTPSEGRGLGEMIGGIIGRYQDAGVPPPEVVYVDRDCCGPARLRSMLRPWHSTEIRLDIWPFMQKLAAGCTADSHDFYADFMNRLSQCIFVWDERDVQALQEAKRAELEAELTHPSDADVTHRITQAELALHCKRTTRGSSETEALITELIQTFDENKRWNTLGSGGPLIDSVRMAKIWEEQKRHLPCIQDPPGVQMYVQTGTLHKGGHSLPTYTCARGSASLECFHLHMNSSIPGTLASATFFQAYLVDSVVRWNDERGTVPGGSVVPTSYSGPLRHAVNQLAQKVLGMKLVDYTEPQKYTGELIGVEYLYDQTGSALEDSELALSALETEEVTVAEDEGCEEPVKFKDFTIPSLAYSGLLSRPPVCPPPLVSSCTSTATSSTPPALPVCPSPLVPSSCTPTATSSTPPALPVCALPVCPPPLVSSCTTTATSSTPPALPVCPSPLVSSCTSTATSSTPPALPVCALPVCPSPLPPAITITSVTSTAAATPVPASKPSSVVDTSSPCQEESGSGEQASTSTAAGLEDSVRPGRVAHAGPKDHSVLQQPQPGPVRSTSASAGPARLPAVPVLPLPDPSTPPALQLIVPARPATAGPSGGISAGASGPSSTQHNRKRRLEKEKAGT